MESALISPTPATREPAASALKRPLRVFVIEPQTLLAKAICQLIKEDADLLSAGDAPAFDAQVLREAAPDLLVLDADGELSELRELVAECRASVPAARLCVLSAHLSADVMLRALSAGADGYLVKDITPSELISSLKAVVQGGFFADQRLSETLLRRHAHKRRRNAEDLSPREMDVVRFIAQGLSNKEISSRLLISDKTIKNHISSIFAKLNLNARTQVAVFAIRNGLV